MAKTKAKKTKAKTTKKDKIKTIAILTGGGDCPGLNAVIRAVAKTAMNKYKLNVWGIEDGFLGLVENRINPLTFESVSNILTEGGTILGSCNKTNPFQFMVKGKAIDVSQECLERLREYEIDALVCLGGDGTMCMANGFAKLGIPVMGVPKTIDNDLPGTDMTFGFDTAVSTATSAIDKIQTTASSHHRVMVVEVMGRYAGWLALDSGVAGGADVILIPEIPYDMEVVCDYVLKRQQKGNRFSIIVVAEGAKAKGGELVVQKVIKDSPDPIRLGGVGALLADDISKKTGLECRSVNLGHMLRGGTPTAFDRNLATILGNYAMEQLMKGVKNRLVVYAGGQLSHVPLSKIAGKTKNVPKNHPLVRAAKAIGGTFGV